MATQKIAKKYNSESFISNDNNDIDRPMSENGVNKLKKSNVSHKKLDVKEFKGNVI